MEPNLLARVEKGKIINEMVYFVNFCPIILNICRIKLLKNIKLNTHTENNEI